MTVILVAGWWVYVTHMKAIRVSQTGGLEVLQYVDIPTPKPAPGEALVRIEAIGVNFIDVYHRTGLYKMPLPFTPTTGFGRKDAVKPIFVATWRQISL